jgi:hypothetical protein
MKTRTVLSWIAIIGLSAVVILAAVYAGLKLDSNKYSPIAGLVSAAASLLAVIWFTSTLIYQARQINEQRQQFSINFAQMHRDAQRNALVVAESVLRDTEARALSQNKTLTSLNDLIVQYMDFSEMSIMLKATEPREVIEAGKKWFLREGPAITLMRGIQTAARIYAESIGDSRFDFTRDPEDFVYIHGPILWKLPYFQNYQTPSDFLSEIMMQIVPARKSAQLAYMIAAAKSSPEGFIKKEKLHKDIQECKEKDYPLPEISKGF